MPAYNPDELTIEERKAIVMSLLSEDEQRDAFIMLQGLMNLVHEPGKPTEQRVTELWLETYETITLLRFPRIIAK
jgi:hypothetical protein